LGLKKRGAISEAGKKEKKRGRENIQLPREEGGEGQHARNRQSRAEKGKKRPVKKGPRTGRAGGKYHKAAGQSKGHEKSKRADSEIKGRG